uniref:Uncharacterized protein n=1 Tax=Homalodisca liturata TaxID=320908 RepID=A0A1B6J8A1_9HEMI
MVKIHKLSRQVQTFLRTGVTMNDTVQCIIELVQNSLDAQSTSIAVRIDLHSFIFQVVDNGHGLTKKELNIIGTRYSELIKRSTVPVLLSITVCVMEQQSLFKTSCTISLSGELGYSLLLNLKI